QSRKDVGRGRRRRSDAQDRPGRTRRRRARRRRDVGRRRRAPDRDAHGHLPVTTAAGQTAADLAVLAPARTGRPVWLRVGTVLDGSGGTPLQDAHLVYDADRIRYVGPAFRPPPPEFLGGPRTGPDAWHPDLTACPMLIEAHAHLFLDGAPIDRQVREAALKLPAATMLDRARARLIRLARM